MEQVCPNCNAPVDEESQRCGNCGEVLDPFLTIQPPKFQNPPAAPAPASERPAARSKSERPALREPPETRSDDAREPAPAPAPRPKRKPRPTAPPPARPAPAPAPPPPQPQYQQQQPNPSPYAPAGYAAPPSPPPYGPPPQGAGPGWIRSKLIKMLGGSADSSPAPPPYPYGPPPGAPAAPQASWGPQPGASGVQPPSSQAPVPPPVPEPVTPIPTADGDDDGLTRVMGGADLKRLKVPSQIISLQILDKNNQWHHWATVGAGGLKVGRAEKTAQFPELNSMATRHMRVSCDGSRVKVEDMGSLNGIYLKLTQPVELEDGARFRVGGQVIAFHKAEPPEPATPLVGENGEEFWAREVTPLAYLDVIRPDGTPGLRIPITRRDQTILGREARPGRPVDLSFPDDEVVSGNHAQIRHEDGHFFLEDLKSRNGTFLLIQGEHYVPLGQELLLGRVLLRVVDQAVS